MGLTDISMIVSNPADRSRSRDVKFLVDSGAICAVVPRTILAEIGVAPERVESFSLADCTQIRREVGSAMFTYQGKTSAAPVIFGEEGDAVLLGVITLEALGLVLDPLRRELRPMVMRL